MAQITRGNRALKACPLLCNERCYCTPLRTVFFLYLFLMLLNTCKWPFLTHIKHPISIYSESYFKFA